MRKTTFLFIIIILSSSLISGCALLIIPGAALVGHSIQKSNEEYDNIIVNLGLKYKQYYNKKIVENEKRESSGLESQPIPEFQKWIETQGNSEKERKAIERYKRTSLNNP